MSGDVLTTGEAGRILGVTARTVGKLIDTGVIRGWRASVHRRICRKDFIRYLHARGIPVKGLWQ